MPSGRTLRAALTSVSCVAQHRVKIVEVATMPRESALMHVVIITSAPYDICRA